MHGRETANWLRSLDKDPAFINSVHAWGEREGTYRLGIEVEEPGGWELRGTLPSGGPMPDITDSAEIVFAAPRRKSGMERTVFLHSRGWYQLHLRDHSEPDNATFGRIMTVPGAAVQFAADRFKEWQRGILH